VRITPAGIVVAKVGVASSILVARSNYSDKIRRFSKAVPRGTALAFSEEAWGKQSE
jgi:hypothetical protein